MSEPYPINYDSLKKGDIITVAQCERILAMNKDDPSYPFGLMGLRERLSTDMEARDRPVTVKISGQCLHILSDEEASAWNYKQQVQSLRRHGRAHRRNLNVDIANLGDDAKIEHERRLLTGGTITHAIQQAKRQITLANHKREVPAVAQAKE